MLEVRPDKKLEEERVVASAERDSSSSKRKRAWVPVGLLPVLMVTAHYGAPLVLLGFWEVACLWAGLSAALRFFFGKCFQKIPRWGRNVLACGCAAVLTVPLYAALSSDDSFMRFLSDFVLHASYGLDVLAILVSLGFFVFSPLSCLFLIIGACCVSGWMVQGVGECITISGQWLKTGGWLKRIAGVGLLLWMMADAICFLYLFRFLVRV